MQTIITHHILSILSLEISSRNPDMPCLIQWRSGQWRSGHGLFVDDLQASGMATFRPVALVGLLPVACILRHHRWAHIFFCTSVVLVAWRESLEEVLPIFFCFSFRTETLWYFSHLDISLLDYIFFVSICVY